MPIEIRFTDNSDEYLRKFDKNALAALEACGQQAASHAKQIITAAGRRRTGTMINSVNSAVAGKNAYVGTNTSYAKYHEYGTGIYIAGGRKTPWMYPDAEGNLHWTRGVPPIHFIKNAVADHIAEYRAIFLKYLGKG